jgi:N-acetyl-alpha-D-muramate 1-phosphate uridylyltransferase
MMDKLPPVAILAGGLATRLYPITETIPKALIDINGKPFIAHQLELLKRNNIDSVMLCIGYLGEMIQDVVGGGSAYGLDVKYSFDGETLLGTGGAIKKALSLLGDDFFVLYGDSYLTCNYQDVYHTFATSDKLGLMTVYKNDDRFDRSNVIFQNGQIVDYDKRQQTPEMHHIDYGLGLLRKDVFADFPNNQPFDLADVYQALVNQEQLVGYETSDRFYEIGSHQGIEELQQYLRK